jgi:hypothetical protein
VLVLLLQLASDLLVAYAMITLHGAVLMCQAMVFAVAMNSKRHALLALLIASNFVEIKGTVNKRTDTTKLWTLVCLVRAGCCRAALGACGCQQLIDLLWTLVPERHNLCLCAVDASCGCHAGYREHRMCLRGCPPSRLAARTSTCLPPQALLVLWQLLCTVDLMVPALLHSCP